MAIVGVILCFTYVLAYISVVVVAPFMVIVPTVMLFTKKEITVFEWAGFVLMGGFLSVMAYMSIPIVKAMFNLGYSLL